MILCLDMALRKSGVAVVEGEHVLWTGTVCTRPTDSMAQRLFELRVDLDSIYHLAAKSFGVETVLIEESSQLQRAGHDRTATIVALARATGIALELAWRAGMEAVVLDPRAVREALAGRPGASKAELHRVLHLEGIGLGIEDTDMLDAISLGVYYARREAFRRRCG